MPFVQLFWIVFILAVLIMFACNYTALYSGY